MPGPAQTLGSVVNKSEVAPTLRCLQCSRKDNKQTNNGKLSKPWERKKLGATFENNRREGDRHSNKAFPGK